MTQIKYNHEEYEKQEMMRDNAGSAAVLQKFGHDFWNSEPM